VALLAGRRTSIVIATAVCGALVIGVLVGKHLSNPSRGTIATPCRVDQLIAQFEPLGAAARQTVASIALAPAPGVTCTLTGPLSVTATSGAPPNAEAVSYTIDRRSGLEATLQLDDTTSAELGLHWLAPIPDDVNVGGSCSGDTIRATMILIRGNNQLSALSVSVPSDASPLTICDNMASDGTSDVDSAELRARIGAR